MQDPSNLDTQVPQEPPAEEHPSMDPEVPASGIPYHEYDLGTRVDGPIRTTFHVYKSEQRIGYFVEKVFDPQNRLLRMVKRTEDGRSETRFDPTTGDIEKIFESYTLPDGNILTKEKKYLPEDHSTESVIVVDPECKLVRTVLREMKSLTNIFTGQTEYSKAGKASLSINHWFDKKTGKLTSREQVQWLSNGQRGVSEHFIFTADGNLVKYHKTIYNPELANYLEETHLYEPRSQALLRKESKSYGEFDEEVAVEITIFDTRGNQLEFTSRIEHRLFG